MTTEQAKAKLDKLHNDITNIPCGAIDYSADAGWRRAYMEGHRDARHAAAKLVSAFAAKVEDNGILRNALEKIVRWHGEFPETGERWPNGQQMSYSACYGSNGERDYMRRVASDALAGVGKVESATCGVLEDMVRALTAAADLMEQEDFATETLVPKLRRAIARANNHEALDKYNNS